MDFEAREDIDGVRLLWSSLPKSKLQHQRNVVPMGAIYTPLNNKLSVPLADASHMVACRQCRAFLNPYVGRNEQQPDVWFCQFCGFSNRFAPDQVPVALESANSSIEYSTGRRARMPPVFFYVVDTCFEAADAEDAYVALKELLTLSLSLLPEDALVGLVLYGKHVQIHELSSDSATPNQVLKNHTFNGSKEYTLEEVQKALGLLSRGLSTGPSNDPLGPFARKFLQPVSMIEYEMTSILSSLVTNTFPHAEMKERPARATGAAINVSSLLLSSILGASSGVGGHLLVFVGGACTYGPGHIVGTHLKEPLRSHHDIERAQHTQLPSVPANITAQNTKVDVSLVKAAKKFYEKVTKQLIATGLSCNFFIGSYDQVGFYEMDEACYKTGGVCVLSDSFSTAIFKQSFLKFFRKQENGADDFLDMGFNASLEVRTASDLKVQGLIGTATALPQRKDNQQIAGSISTTAVGEGGTNLWKLCNVNPQSSYAVLFEKADSLQLGHTFVQFLCHYQHPSGELRLRVTTIPVAIVADSDGANLEAGFDQQAAAVLVARDAISRLQTTTTAEVLKHLDKVLMDFCARFAVYTKGVLESFRLLLMYAMLPQFMYHLRRLPFIQVFNNSPDETSFVRHVFMHEDTTNALIMIQPTLLSYDIDTYGTVDEDGVATTDPEPVLLDLMSLGPTKILLLDTFFHILIHHGLRVAEWRKADFHHQAGYEHFREFLEAPKKEAMGILMDRFPLPRFIDCDEGGSQARFLMAKLNPSTSYLLNPNQLYGGQPDVLTDDASLQLFMDHVQRVVVSRK